MESIANASSNKADGHILRDEKTSILPRINIIHPQIAHQHIVPQQTERFIRKTSCPDSKQIYDCIENITVSGFLSPEAIPVKIDQKCP